MLALLIHLIEIVVVVLIGLLVKRVYNLMRQEELISDSQIDAFVRLFAGHTDRKEDANYTTKMKSLEAAHVFVGSQLVAIKREFENLEQEQLNWLRAAISLYLIGAIDFIGKQANCSADSRRQMINTVLKTNLRLSQENAFEYFNEALYRSPASDSDHMVRAGAKAAKIWLKKKDVPQDFSLRSQLDDWGVFA